jgi:hypothetical protein
MILIEEQALQDAPFDMVIFLSVASLLSGLKLSPEFINIRIILKNKIGRLRTPFSSVSGDGSEMMASPYGLAAYAEAPLHGSSPFGL